MSVPALPNVFTPTLGAGITNVATSLTTSAAVPDAGHVWMVIDGEGMDGDASGSSVTGLNRASFKVNGVASAASHSTGATIYFVSAFEAMKACFPYKFAEQSGASATYTFTAPTIAGTTLVIKYCLRDNSATNGEDLLQIQFNGDAGVNYEGQRLTSNAAVTTSADQVSATQANIGIVMGGNSAANSFSHGEIVIPFYAKTANYKMATGRVATTNGTGANLRWVEGLTAQWNNTAAITSVVIKPSTGSFDANSFATGYVEP